MGELGTGVVDALRLVMSGDRYLWSIGLLSLYVSVAALVISAVMGIPLGAWVGLRSFTGRRFVTTLIYTGMGLPPVVVGLVVYLLLSRSGPLGVLGWLVTPRAMILAQTLISLPLVTGLTMSAIEGVGTELRRQLRALGATPVQVALRSEEHTSELQSRQYLVCRLLLE